MPGPILSKYPSDIIIKVKRRKVTDWVRLIEAIFLSSGNFAICLIQKHLVSDDTKDTTARLLTFEFYPSKKAKVNKIPFYLYLTSSSP